jgi:hypothetical protein
MIASLPAIAVPLDVQATIAFDDRSEVRARRSTGDTHAAIDLVEMVGARVHTDDRRWTSDLAVVPTLTLPDMATSFAPQVLTSGSAHLAAKTRTTVLALDGDGTYGYENFGYLAPIPGASAFGGERFSANPPTLPTQSVQPIPSTSTLELGQARGFFSLLTKPSARWDISLRAGYTFSGGIDASSRLFLPQQSGPRADAQAHYALSRTDLVGATALAWYVGFTGGLCPAWYPASARGSALGCSPEDEVAEAMATWKHSWSPFLTTMLGAGVGVAEVRLLPTDFHDFYATPAGVATLEWRERRARGELHAIVEGRVTQVVDAVSGAIDLRVLPTVRLEARHERTTTRLTLALAESLTPDRPTAANYVLGGAELSYAFLRKRNAEVAVGLREGRTHENGFTPLVSTTAYVSLVIQTPVQYF